MTDYNDSYPGCDAAYASLTVLSDDVDPSEVTTSLGIRPSEVFVRGDPIGRDGRGSRQRHGWFLRSKNHVESRDLRRHLDWLLERLQSKRDELSGLRRRGVRMRVSCFYVSSTGHGGPTLSPPQMERMADLGLDCWLDVYGPTEDGAV